MPIANFFIVRILNYIRVETDYDEDDVDMMRYSLQAILWEIEKTLYLLLLFIALGYQWHFFATLFALITIRPTAGGFHSSTVWGCFAWTLLGFVLAFFVLPLIPFNQLTIGIVALFSIVVTFIGTPVRSKQMEKIADPSKDTQKKYKATLITTIWFMLIFFVPAVQNLFVIEAVMWIIFLQSLQLIIEYGRREMDIR
ncbi:MAG: accessory gene regulator B family protein [Defluviitaleaceae bacterium]|nr:accessory gene regulator B family protein [Defluviitaleaceae bacterium]